MVQESAPDTQISNGDGMLPASNWVLGTAMLFRNVGSFSLDCQISDAGYARPVLRDAGNGLCSAIAGDAPHAPFGVCLFGAANHAMPSCDGTVEAAPVRIVGNFAAGQR
jgi:hypothetical protein